MSERSDAPLAQSEALALYTRLRAGSRHAADEIATAYMDWLVERLRRTQPSHDPHLYCTAAADTLMALIQKPASYDPRRLPLDRYLFMAARADLKNLLKSEQRRDERVVRFRSVDDPHGAPEPPTGEHDDPERLAELREQLRERQGEIPERLLDGLTPEQRRAAALWLEGERKTERLADALSIRDLPADRQRHAVKQFKDRLSKRWERGGGSPRGRRT